MCVGLANLLFFYLLLLVKQNMSSVLPEFVNKIVNKVTNNTTTPPAQNIKSQEATNSKVNASAQSVSPINNATRNIDNFTQSNNKQSNNKKSNNMGEGNNLGLDNELNNLNSSNSGINNLNSDSKSNTATTSRKNNSIRTASITQNTPDTRQTYIQSQIPRSDMPDNLTNAEKMRELIDSIIISNLDVDKRNRILNVIKTALTSTQTQENRDFDKFNQRYDAMHQPQNIYYPGMSTGYMQPPLNMYYPGQGGYIQPMQSMYYPQQMNTGYMQSPQNMYFPQQQPVMQYDMLFNKMNMIQMEMADLTRHLRDYTRRYMDNMRESDMDQIKNYIEELMKVQDSVNQVTETMTPQQDESTEDKSSLMDKATSSLKSGFSTVTNTVNSIGSKLGLTDEPATTTPVEEPQKEPVAEPINEIEPEDLEDEDLNNLPAPENNMMSVDDYAKQAVTPSQPDQSNAQVQPEQAEQPSNKVNITKRNTTKVNNKQATLTKPAELSNAIKELNKQNQARAPSQQQQQQGGGKKTKKELSILEQFEKMLSIKRQTKKVKK
jgi:hypothetical protein